MEAASIAIKVKGSAPDPTSIVRGILIEVGSDATVGGEGILAGGDVVALDIRAPDLAPFNIAELKAVELRIESTPFAGEFWSDVSMLTLRPAKAKPNPSRRDFSFDWLFTGSDLAPSQAVTPTELLQMVEAEARIIAISPPIPVVED